jgi:hypothetical protein
LLKREGRKYYWKRRSSDFGLPGTRLVFLVFLTAQPAGLAASPLVAMLTISGGTWSGLGILLLVLS